MTLFLDGVSQNGNRIPTQDTLGKSKNAGSWHIVGIDGA